MRKSVVGLALMGVASVVLAQEAAPPNPNPNMPAEERLAPPGTAPGTSPVATPDEDEARMSIRDAGYSSITELKRDGSDWTARAKMDGKPVNVRVAPDGSVREVPLPR